MGLNSDERQKVNTQNGSWFCQLDQNQICHMILVAQSFSERLSYAFIRENREHIEKLAQYFMASDSTVTKHMKDRVKELMAKYDDPANMDALSKAQNNINEVQVIVGKNIDKMVANQGNLENLQNKTQRMKDLSQTFEKNSGDLHRLLWWRNMKLNIIIGCIVIALILYFVVPYIRTATTAKSVSYTHLTLPTIYSV
eukprot:TRINITY_DN1302_c0_g1_i3.p1 TRINITY_DN1302_c0_g1~~TRINITY_DN1302_c0_g1_i3.p1  ORF type:complete len:197 (-),score=54.03 TRINITY_DN1302_c0_g1_i3:37-627(-)